MKKILVLLIPFILCGCWNYKELNQLAIVSGMAIEKENDEYVLTAQIINSQNPMFKIHLILMEINLSIF